MMELRKRSVKRKNWRTVAEADDFGGFVGADVSTVDGNVDVAVSTVEVGSLYTPDRDHFFQLRMSLPEAQAFAAKLKEAVETAYRRDEDES